MNDVGFAHYNTYTGSNACIGFVVNLWEPCTKSGTNQVPGHGIGAWRLVYVHASQELDFFA